MSIVTTLIVPATLRDTCAQLCAALAGPAGAGMFVQPLYSGSDTPSHYFSSGWVDTPFRDALPCTYTDEEGELVTRPADYESLMAMVQAAGIEVTQQELEALLSQCDVSAQGWREAVARLGLSVNPVYEEIV